MAGQLVKIRLALYSAASMGFNLRRALKETTMPDVTIRIFLNKKGFHAVVLTPLTNPYPLSRHQQPVQDLSFEFSTP